MYPKKEGKVLPKIFLAEMDRDIAARIAQALRTDFPSIKSAATKLAEQVEINIETLKKWYGGHHAPSAANLIILARGSPAVRRMLIELIGKEDCD
jgi:hypothetical protein